MSTRALGGAIAIGLVVVGLAILFGVVLDGREQTELLDPVVADARPPSETVLSAFPPSEGPRLDRVEVRPAPDSAKDRSLDVALDRSPLMSVNSLLLRNARGKSVDEQFRWFGAIVEGEMAAGHQIVDEEQSVLAGLDSLKPEAFETSLRSIRCVPSACELLFERPEGGISPAWSLWQRELGDRWSERGLVYAQVTSALAPDDPDVIVMYILKPGLLRYLEDD